MPYRTKYGKCYHDSPGCAAIAGKESFSCPPGGLSPCSLCYGGGSNGSSGISATVFPSEEVSVVIGEDGSVTHVPDGASIVLQSDGSVVVTDKGGKPVQASSTEVAVTDDWGRRMVVDQDGNWRYFPYDASHDVGKNGCIIFDRDMSKLDDGNINSLVNIFDPNGPFGASNTSLIRQEDWSTTCDLFNKVSQRLPQRRGVPWPPEAYHRAPNVLMRPSLASIAIQRARMMARLATRMGFKHPRAVMPLLDGVEHIAMRHPVAKLQLMMRKERAGVPGTFVGEMRIQRIKSQLGCSRREAEALIDMERENRLSGAQERRDSMMAQRGTTVEQELRREFNNIDIQVRNNLHLYDTQANLFTHKVSPIPEQSMTVDQRIALAEEYQRAIEDFGFGDKLDWHTFDSIVQGRGYPRNSTWRDWDCWTQGLYLACEAREKREASKQIASHLWWAHTQQQRRQQQQQQQPTP